MPARRGRPPRVPDEVKRAKGNPGHRPLNEQAPDPPPARTDVKPPQMLNAAAARVWKSTVKAMHEAGTLKVTDLYAVATFCNTTADLWRYEELAEQDAELALAKGYQGMVVKLRALQKQLMGELALPPSSRTGVKVEKPKPKSTLDKYRKRGKSKVLSGAFGNG